MKANLLLCFIVPGLFDTPQFFLLFFPSLTDFVKRKKKKKNLAVYSKSDRNENHSWHMSLPLFAVPLCPLPDPHNQLSL